MADNAVKLTKLLLLVPDLMMGTRIEETAHKAGRYQIVGARTSDDFEAVLAREQPDVVILTFDRTGEAWTRLAEAAQRRKIKTIAFGSHMNTGAFKRARELGCAEVIANSKMNSDLPGLLEKWSGESR